MCVEMETSARGWCEIERESGSERGSERMELGERVARKSGGRIESTRRCCIGGYRMVVVCMSFGVEVGCFTWANSMYHEEIMYNI